MATSTLERVLVCIKVSAEGGEPITLAESDSPSRVGFGRPSSLPGDEALLITTWSESAG